MLRFYVTGNRKPRVTACADLNHSLFCTQAAMSLGRPMSRKAETLKKGPDLPSTDERWSLVTPAIWELQSQQSCCPGHLRRHRAPTRGRTPPPGRAQRRLAKPGLSLAASPALPRTCCAALGTRLSLSEPLCPHPQSQDKGCVRTE